MQITNVLVVMYVMSSAYCEPCQSNCQIGRVKGLKFADCYRRDLLRVPQCLPGSIEILDLSVNRIREISEEDLKPYSYLQILYLTDNKLTDIDEHALDDLTDLHTIDISSNVFYNIPSSLFTLPVLRKLLLGGIRNQKMLEDIENAVPITSPLIHLDLSDNRLQRLPVLGEIPTLQYYNVTGNKNVKLNTTMFAGLCNLQEFIDVDFSASFEDPCECFILEQWLTTRRVQFTSFNCERRDCTNQIPEMDMSVFKNCRKLHEAQQQQMYKKKLLTNVGISMGTISLFLLILLFFIVRRRRARKQKIEKEKQAHSKQRKEAVDDLL